MEEESEVMVISGRLAKFKIGKAEFRDSWNIIPVAQGKLTDKVEIEDFSIFERDKRDIPKNRAIIRERLRKDCVGLWHDMLTPFIQKFGLHLTQAGASMAAWRKITGEKKPKTPPEFYNALKSHYYGGRVECFKVGIIDRPFKIIDINSAYPDAMMHMHPYGDQIFEGNHLPDTDAAISRSFITLAAYSTGAFPYRAADNSLTFPADNEIRTFHVTGWEYLAARDTGYLLGADVLNVYVLSGTIEFSAYLDHFYQMKVDAKRRGDKPAYEAAKRFLNSLYGKFGANPDNYEEYKIIQPRFIEACEIGDGYGFCAELGPWALMSRPLPEYKQHYFNVATAASITGYVRANLWRSSRRITGLAYMDTDCMWVESTGDLELDPEKLGMWDIEAECDYGAIAGKKLYAARTTSGKWKTASKGVRLKPEQIEQIAKGQTVKYLPEAPTFSLKKGIIFTPRNIARTTI